MTKYLEGLTTSQKKKVESLIEDVCSTYLGSTRQIASSLRELKDNLSDEAWKSFTKADLLPFGSKTISDYLFTHTFLTSHETQNIPDSVLNRTSIRTLVMMISNRCSIPFGELIERMESGEIIRQRHILELLGKESQESKKESVRTTLAQLEEEKQDLQVEVQRISSKLVEALDECNYYKTTLRMLENAHGLERNEYESQDIKVKKRYQKLLEVNVVDKLVSKNMA